MSFDGSRIGRSQITDSRVRNVATCTGEATLFCGVRTWCERPCSRRVTSGASPHRWIIPGGSSGCPPDELRRGVTRLLLRI